MEIIIKTITFISIITLIVLPILILNKIYKQNTKNIFIIYLITSIITTFILVLIVGWWGSFSNEILLSYYGFDFDAMNDIERFKNVALENLEKVKELEKNTLGIGWPLKAFMFFLIYSPYLLIVYISTYFYRKNSKHKLVAK
ncbi:hypothetical protein [Flavobacterium sp. AJR]|uniref:hypothetical protein n=1 Tax=Flavobacterium sp. AJR TaxID=1979369 RepID=UPI000A3D679E|nr:hypothetical protein [Flavobacterium sp. AJR]OUL60836.1 hypothetical protein B8T70_18175 [Flavobacterium sp. AJR]